MATPDCETLEDAARAAVKAFFDMWDRALPPDHVVNAAEFAMQDLRDHLSDVQEGA